MRREPALIACGALVLVLSACGSAHHATAVPKRPLTPQERALHDPQTLLQRIAIPPRAVPTPRPRKGLLSWPRDYGLGVGATRSFRVPLPYGTVFHFFERQHPRGAMSSSGMLIGRVRVFGQNHEFDWSLRPIRHFLSSRQIHVMLLARSSNVTLVRVHVEDVWNVRPPTERVPAGVQAITIRRDRAYSIPRVSARITDPAKVRRVVHWFEALPLFTPSMTYGGCPLMVYSPVVVSFLSATGRILAAATILSGGTGGPCGGGIAVTVSGRQQPMLEGDFLERVLKLARVPRQARV